MMKVHFCYFLASFFKDNCIAEQCSLLLSSKAKSLLQSCGLSHLLTLQPRNQEGASRPAHKI